MQNLRMTMAIMLGVTAAAAAGPVFAQTARSGGGESQKIMQQYQQLAAERASLKAQVAQLQMDLDAAKSEVIATRKERDALKNRGTSSATAIAQAVSAKQAADQSLEQSKQRTADLVARFRETAQNLKEVEIDRTKVRSELTEKNAAFDKCAESNLQLFEISTQVMDRYERVGMFTRVTASEPLTKLTRIRIENLVDDYRGRAEELRVKKP